MKSSRKTYLDKLYQAYSHADSAQTNRLHRWRSIEPESAELPAILVLGKQAKTLLEIGTSGGYSTVWLADAAEQTGGHLTILEIDPARQETALKHLAATGLADITTALCTDAGAFLQSNRTVFDFILLDAERPAYPDYWPYLKRSLSAGGLLAVDNVLSHAEQVRDFIALVRADSKFEQTIVPVGAGLLLAVKKQAV